MKIQVNKENTLTIIPETDFEDSWLFAWYLENGKENTSGVISFERFEETDNN